MPIEIQEKMRNRKNDLSVMMRRISSARYKCTLRVLRFEMHRVLLTRLVACNVGSVTSLLLLTFFFSLLTFFFSIRHTINELTEDDEEMALMNLTALKTKPSLYQ